MNSRKPNWRARLHEIIFESTTAEGRLFDILLLAAILLSTLVVMLDSVASLHQQYGTVFLYIEWTFTVLFSIEYLLRLICIQQPWKYMRSFTGIIDLLAIIPTYLSIFIAGSQSLMVLRALRLLRVFRIFKLVHFLSEMRFLGMALRSSLKKITVFLVVVFILVIILGAVMYLVEKGENGFYSIPECIYWAIVTITSVGYGDNVPVTLVGKMVASIIMLLGYGIIAVPTGIIASDMAQKLKNNKMGHETCPSCGKEGHDADARHCKFCGSRL
jgi:voltage-gated potassium channel